MKQDYNKYKQLFRESELKVAEEILIEKKSLVIYWDDFFDSWFRAKKAPITLINVYNTLRLFMQEGDLWFIENWNNPKRLEDIFHEISNRRGWSSVTFNSYRKNANTFFLFLQRREYIGKNPIKGVQKMKEQKTDYSIPTAVDIGNMFAYIKEMKTRSPMIRIRYEIYIDILTLTGIRPSEALHIKRGDIEDGELLIHSVKTGEKPRRYSLPTRMLSNIDTYYKLIKGLGREYELDDYFFLGDVVGRSWSYTGIRKFLERMGRALGKKFSSYSFRRLNATELFENGIPLEQISKHMGHSRTSTTLGYVQGMAKCTEKTTNNMRSFLEKAKYTDPKLSYEERIRSLTNSEGVSQ